MGATASSVTVSWKFCPEKMWELGSKWTHFGAQYYFPAIQGFVPSGVVEEELDGLDLQGQAYSVPWLDKSVQWMHTLYALPAYSSSSVVC